MKKTTLQLSPNQGAQVAPVIDPKPQQVAWLSGYGFMVVDSGYFHTFLSRGLTINLSLFLCSLEAPKGENGHFAPALNDRKRARVLDLPSSVVSEAAESCSQLFHKMFRSRSHLSQVESNSIKLKEIIYLPVYLSSFLMPRHLHTLVHFNLLSNSDVTMGGGKGDVTYRMAGVPRGCSGA